MSGGRTLSLGWPLLGPYHAARLDALAAAVSEANGGAGGDRVVGLETDPADDTYAWDFTPTPAGWEHVRGDGPASVPKRLSAIRPDVVFVNGWGYASSQAALRWALRANVPAVLFCDSRGDDAGRGGWRRGLADTFKRRLVGLFDAAVVAGAPHRRFVERLGMPADRVFEGLDVVDNDHFAAAIPLRDESRIANRANGEAEPRFLFVGRFVPKKNAVGLVEAFARYRRGPIGETVGGSLTLVGEGPDEAAVRAAAEGVPGVRFEPFRQYDELPAIYAAADALVLPSVRSEQWGLVVNEAMAAGLPVLVAEGCGCVEDLVEPGENGLTFNPHTPGSLTGSLTAALERFAELPPERRAAWGRRSVEAIADWTPARFASAARSAADVALADPRPRRIADRLAFAAVGLRGERPY